MPEGMPINRVETNVVDGGDQDTEGSEYKSAVARAAEKFAQSAEANYQKRVEFQDNLVESTKERAELIKTGAVEIGGNALGFAKKVGKVGVEAIKTVGLTTLGMAVMGVEAGSRAVNNIKESATESYTESKNSLDEKVENAKSFFADKKEAAQNRIAARKAAREDRRRIKAETKAENAANKAEQKRIAAIEKAREDSLKAEARKAERDARREKARELKESVYNNVSEKKAAINDGMDKIKSSALNFFKKARLTGQAAYNAASETWNNYNPDEFDDSSER